MVIFKEIGQPLSPFCFFGHLKHKFYKRNVGCNEIRARIVGIEGEHADHMTTTIFLLHDLNHAKFVTD